MSEDKTHQSPPEEGSNRGNGPEDQLRANITDTSSGRHPKSDSEHTDDGLPGEVERTDGDNELPQPDKSQRPPQE